MVRLPTLFLIEQDLGIVTFLMRENIAEDFQPHE
jgi:hypothetical protein